MEDYKLLNFIDLTMEEKLLVLEWRNTETIKSWMYNQSEIQIEEHLSFIDSLVNNDNKLYFLLKKSNEYLGVIDFTDITKDSCYFGFYSNPNSMVVGIGRILEKVSLTYAFETLKVNKLKLEVFKNNIQVKNLHKKNRFKEVDEIMVNNKEVICMELRYEDR